MNIYFDLFNILYILIKAYLKYKLRLNDWNNTVINLLIELGNLNIIFIKFFQWFHSDKEDSNYISEEIINHISQYNNNAPYTNEDIDYDSLDKLYLIAEKEKDILLINDLIPINSGSVALVFKAKLNNKDIVIKLLRKNIYFKIKKGLDLLYLLLTICKFIPFINIHDADRFIEKNKLLILDQTNFLNELNNIEKFYACFKKHKYVIVPLSYRIYTEQINSILLMDFIDGMHINELNLEDKDNFLISYSKFMISTFFIKNIVHADLHHGNIFFM